MAAPLSLEQLFPTSQVSTPVPAQSSPPPPGAGLPQPAYDPRVDHLNGQLQQLAGAIGTLAQQQVARSQAPVLPPDKEEYFTQEDSRRLITSQEPHRELNQMARKVKEAVQGEVAAPLQARIQQQEAQLYQLAQQTLQRQQQAELRSTAEQNRRLFYDSNPDLAGKDAIVEHEVVKFQMEAAQNPTLLAGRDAESVRALIAERSRQTLTSLGVQLAPSTNPGPGSAFMERGNTARIPTPQLAQNLDPNQRALAEMSSRLGSRSQRR